MRVGIPISYTISTTILAISRCKEKFGSSIFPYQVYSPELKSIIFTKQPDYHPDSDSAIEKAQTDVDEAIQALGVINGMFFTAAVLYTAYYAQMHFLESLWHGLGVGTIVVGFLLILELIVMGLYACCAICGR